MMKFKQYKSWQCISNKAGHIIHVWMLAYLIASYAIPMALKLG